jgi:hypothetical protein
MGILSIIPFPIYGMGSNMKSCILLLLALLVGCSTLSPSDPAPRFAERVQAALSEAGHRPPTTSVELIIPQDLRPRRSIARLTAEGKADDEGALQNAMMWKARQIGGQAILFEPEKPTFTGTSRLRTREQARRVFTAEVFIFQEDAI